MFFPALPHASPRRFDDAALWLIAATHTLFAVLLVLTLATLSPAQAQDDPACGGVNILTELKEKDPARYRTMAEEANATPNGNSIFWRIEKPGLAPSWLLGTMHLTDPRVLTMPEAARIAHERADSIIIESDEILDEKMAAAALLAKPELTMFTDGSTLTSQLSAKDAARLEAGLKSRGIALTMVKRMKPWMLSSMVALPACELARKASGVSFLDKKIAEDARAKGKKIVGLETLSEQFSAMADLPMNLHLQALIQALEPGGRMNDVVETMTELYIAGDIGRIIPMLTTVTPAGLNGEGASYAAFEQRIIIDRNRIMAARAAPQFEKGNVFMAVGALHLPGTEGLVELLRKAGYTVTAAL